MNFELTEEQKMIQRRATAPEIGVSDMLTNVNAKVSAPAKPAAAAAPVEEKPAQPMNIWDMEDDGTSITDLTTIVGLEDAEPGDLDIDLRKLIENAGADNGFFRRDSLLRLELENQLPFGFRIGHFDPDRFTCHRFHRRACRRHPPCCSRFAKRLHRRLHS